MTKIFRIVTLSICYIAFVGTLFAEESARSSRASQQVVYFNIGDEPPSLDPTRHVDSVSAFWLGHLYEGLMSYNSQGKLAFGTAEKVEVSADKKTYIYTIRANAKWQDGKPVVADDFVFAFQRLVDPKYASDYSFIAEVAQITNAGEIIAGKKPLSALGVSAVDARTLKISLDRPTAFFPALMAFQSFFPVRRDLVKKFGDKFATSIESIVGNGPFHLTDWKKEQSMRIEKAPQYWNASKIKLHAIETPSIVKDSLSTFNLYQTGSLDLITLDSSLLPLALKEKMQIKTVPDGGVSFIQTNRRTGRLFSSTLLRNALKRGLNRSELVYKVVATPGNLPAFWLVPSGIGESLGGKDFRKSAMQHWPDNDLPGAQKLVKQYLAEKKLKELPPISLLCSDSSKSKIEAEYLQSNLQKIFMTKVSIDCVAAKTRMQKARDGDYDLAMSGWGPDYNDPLTYLSIFSAHNENNKSGWDHQKYVQMLNDAQSTADIEKRNKILHQAEQFLLDEAVVVPYMHSASSYVQAKNLLGVSRRTFTQDPDFRYAYWK